MGTLMRIGKWRVVMNPRGREHNPPHVHIVGGGANIVIYLDGWCEGDPKALREAAEVVAWVEAHRAELLRQWGEE